jgi:hypothetical protein
MGGTSGSGSFGRLSVGFMAYAVHVWQVKFQTPCFKRSTFATLSPCAKRRPSGVSLPHRQPPAGRVDSTNTFQNIH